MKHFVVFSFIVMSMLLSGCEKEDDPYAEEVVTAESEIKTIQMMVFANEGMFKNYQAVISAFHQSQDTIRVELENLQGEDWSDYEFRMRSRIMAGDAPDIVDVSVVYQDAIIEDGLLLDLMPYVETSDLNLDLYFSNQFEGLKRGNSLYGIPSGALLMAAYINKELFREAGVPLPGLDWENTWSWDEFSDAAMKIAALGNAEREVYGMTMSFTIGWIFPFLISNQSDFLIQYSESCDVLDQNAEETFTFLKTLMFDEGVSPDMMKLVSLQPYQYFFDKKVGIFIDGNWWMEAAQSNADFEWGVVPMPVSKEPATGMYVDSWAITADSKYPEESFELLKFFLGTEAQNSGVMKGIPLLKSAAHDIYTDRFSSLSENEIDVWFNGVGYGITPAYFRGWNDFQNETTEILRAYSFNELSVESLSAEICKLFLDSRE